MTPELDRGWIPIRVFGHAAPFGVDLTHLGPARLTEPFFENEIQRLMWRPFHHLFRARCSLDELAERAERLPGIPPSGFIFHMSRCGSTLVSQMLAAVPRHVVLSEAPPIDAVLQLDHRDPSVTDAQRIRWLRAMVSALGQPRAGGEDRLFIKMDCWHTLFLPLIRRAFPEVPWIFLYRDPVEVLVSHARRRGGQMLPGVLPPALLGLRPEALPTLSLDAYAEHLLFAVCDAALRNLDEKGRVVPYAGLTDFVLDGLGDHFGLAFSDAERAQMAEAARYDAKAPGMPFTPDVAAKQAEATQAQRAIAAERLTPLFDRLESLRRRA